MRNLRGTTQTSSSLSFTRGKREFAYRLAPWIGEWNQYALYFGSRTTVVEIDSGPHYMATPHGNIPILPRCKLVHTRYYRGRTKSSRGRDLKVRGIGCLGFKIHGSEWLQPFDAYLRPLHCVQCRDEFRPHDPFEIPVAIVLAADSSDG